jgi:hypothetical protein
MRTRGLALLAGTLLLAGCGGGKEAASTTTAPPPTTTSPAVPQAAVIAIQVEQGKPVGGIRRVEAKNGQLIELVVNSDVADEVHLHGYDLHQDVEAGGTARIRFKANISGVFEAELENRKLQILELTVR